MRLGAGALVEVLPRRRARQHRSGVADHPKSLSLIIRAASAALLEIAVASPRWLQSSS